MRPALLDLLACPRTGQPLALETIEAGQAGVEYGFLSSEVATYPVVSGIPVFLPGQEAVVELLRRGRTREATAAAAFDALPTRLGSVLSALEGGGRIGRLVRVPARLHRGRERAAGVRAVFGDGGRPGFEVVRHAYLESAAPSADAYNYFRFRFGIPRHLVALSFIESVSHGDGPLLDLGCGAGHMTWALRQRLPDRPVVGLDSTFFLLLVARHQMVPGADFVCADATALPFRDGGFSFGFSSDVLSYVSQKSAAIGELERVLAADGTLALTSLRNRLCSHVFGGEALCPAGWRRLVAHLPHRLMADTEVVEAYLDRRGVPANAEVGDEALADAQTLSILAGRQAAAVVVDPGRFVDWPHARGRLAVNPLYVPVPGDAATVTYARTWPSPTYLEDNRTMAGYLPERFSLSRAALEQACQGRRPDELEALVSSLAVLGLPDGYVEDRWPAG